MSLSLLNTVIVPRKIVCDRKIINTEIYGFTDASIKYYGTYIYLRSTGDCRDYSTKFIFAKSKIAPFKTILLQRLELCIAL